MGPRVLLSLRAMVLWGVWAEGCGHRPAAPRFQEGFAFGPARSLPFMFL